MDWGKSLVHNVHLRTNLEDILALVPNTKSVTVASAFLRTARRTGLCYLSSSPQDTKGPWLLEWEGPGTATRETY